jgi:O-antigen/teichoic acid export membrane protein
MALRTLVLFAVGFAMLPLLVHHIGARRTGLFVFATTLTGYFTAVELGLGTSVTKYVAEHRAQGARETLNSILRSSLLLMSGIGGLIALGLFVFALVGARSLFNQATVHGAAEPTMLVAAATALLYWPSRLGTAALEGLERYDLRSLVGITVMLVTLAGVFALVHATDSVPALAAFFGAMLVVEGIICGALSWPHLGLGRQIGRWWGSHLRPVAGFGSALFVIGIADTFVYSLDRTILAGFIGAAAIVVYEVALRPHNGVRAVSALAGGALVSTASRLFAARREKQLQELAVVGSFIGLIVTLPVAVLVLALAKPLIVAWVGRSYGRYAVYVQIFVSYWLLHANTGVLGAVITGIGRMRLFVVLTVIGGIVTLGLSIGLTIAWGTVGVIWGTVIPAWVGMPIWMHYALRHVGLSWRVYVRYVVFPAYGLVGLWTGAVLGAKLALDPHGLIELGVFGVVATGIVWIAALPSLLTHWRRAIAGGAGGGSTPAVVSP